MPYQGYQGLNVQSYLPVNKRRELSEAEEAQVAGERGKLLRAPFASDADPIARKMASPGLRALASGGAATLMAGALVAAFARKQGTRWRDTAALAGGAGSLAGLLAGGATYLNEDRINRDLEERMRRLPEGARIRDMKADPVYQKEMDRAAMARAAMARNAAMAGYMRGLV